MYESTITTRPNILKSKYAGIAVNDLKPRNNNSNSNIGNNKNNNNNINKKNLGSNGPNVIATLRADGRVYAKDSQAAEQLANLMNYKIRTDGDVANNKSTLQTLGVPTTVVDLGKQLLKYARDSDFAGVKLMISRDAAFTSDWLGMTALHFAAMNNQYDICELLLRTGINKDSRTKVDRTPLHIACYYGNESIVKLLLSRNCQINPRDMLRMTPLHWAIEKRHKAVARLLINHLADVMVISKFGKTPLALAVLTEQADLLEELQSARKSQIERQNQAQHEKEVSAAVDSIMGESSSNTKTSYSEFQKKLKAKCAINNNNNNNNSNSNNSNNHNKNSTMHLLHKHGISVQKDENESSDLLNTALRYGRQLVLTEGGKMLLTESGKSLNKIPAQRPTQINAQNQRLVNNTTLSNTNSVYLAKGHLSEKNKQIFPVFVTNASTPSTSSVTSAKSKTLNSIITDMPRAIRTCPTTPTSSTMSNNQNVRIISMNEFKKKYAKQSVRNMNQLPPLPPQLVSRNARAHLGLPDVASILSDVDRKPFHQNVEGTKKIKLNPPIESMATVHVGNSDSEGSDVVASNEIVETFKPEIKTTSLRRINISNTSINSNTKNIVNNISNNNTASSSGSSNNIKRVEMQASQMSALNAAMTRNAVITNNTTQPSQVIINNTTPGSFIPSLTLSDVCRQLFDLRRQHNDLKRKFDVSQKEKEDMRMKLERLEELFLVEKTVETAEVIKVENDTTTFSM